MAANVSIVYDPQARQPTLGGDIGGMVILVELTGNYPAGGEPIDFAALGLAREVFGMAYIGNSRMPAGGEYLVPVPVRASATVWNLRMYATGAAAGAVLDQFAAGPYPADMDYRFLVWGRPFTDAT